MEEELRNYLEGMEARMEARMDRGLNGVASTLGGQIDALRTDMDRRFDRMVESVAGEIGSLHTDMGARFARVDERLESIDARLKLQAGLLQAGSRAMARYSEFSENSEQRWIDLTGRVAAIERRLEGK